MLLLSERANTFSMAPYNASGNRPGAPKNQSCTIDSTSKNFLSKPHAGWVRISRKRGSGVNPGVKLIQQCIVCRTLVVCVRVRPPPKKKTRAMCWDCWRCLTLLIVCDFDPRSTLSTHGATFDTWHQSVFSLVICTGVGVRRAPDCAWNCCCVAVVL